MKYLTFIIIFILASVLFIGCSIPNADVPVVTPEVTPEPVQTPEPTPEITPEPVPTWVERFATIHADMRKIDFDRLFFEVESVPHPEYSDTYEWINEDGIKITVYINDVGDQIGKVGSAFLDAHPSLFYNPDILFDFDRFIALNENEYKWDEMFELYPDTIASLNAQEGGQHIGIFYEDILEMVGRIDGIMKSWFGSSQGFIWNDGNHVLTVDFNEDMEVKILVFYEQEN